MLFLHFVYSEISKVELCSKWLLCVYHFGKVRRHEWHTECTEHKWRDSLYFEKNKSEWVVIIVKYLYKQIQIST